MGVSDCSVGCHHTWIRCYAQYTIGIGIYRFSFRRQFDNLRIIVDLERVYAGYYHAYTLPRIE